MGLSNQSQIIGYLGPQGTYSEEVAVTLYGQERYTFQAYSGIDCVIKAVAEGEISVGVVPVENSVEGSVNVTLDSLAHDVDLFITQEFIHPIKNNLLVKPATEDIRVILSHAQPLAQCRRYLSEHFPYAELKAVESTAKAAALVAQGDSHCAAIGSLHAGKLYGLTCFAKNIQDSSSNCTRFIVVKTAPALFQADIAYKTSLVCRIKGESPGRLCEILIEFAKRDINLTKIESRPAKTGLGEYIFFFDIEGHLSEIHVCDALQAIAAKSLWLKKLGSYPIYHL